MYICMFIYIGIFLKLNHNGSDNSHDKNIYTAIMTTTKTTKTSN